MRSSRTGWALASAATLWSSVLAAPASLPCDIYASGNAPCVAAHSTTRALYGAFKDALYQVTRKSDSATIEIYPLSTGGIANASAQDTFCTHSTCVISIIYDQSGNENHLTRAPGGAVKGVLQNHADMLASAIGAPVTVNGQRAYGVFISPGTGYRNNHAKGTTVGDGSEGIYAVVDGTHFNDKCCFDYGNAETSNTDTGAGHMQALYFGRAGAAHGGSGNGPWIMADLENGLFAGEDKKKKNLNNPAQTSRFITAMLKGRPAHWALRGGDASAGPLSTYYDGKRPKGYKTMHEEGSIVLGIGGDNNHRDQGTFYEGVMLSDYPSDATENLVQANIVAARYAVGEFNTGSELSIGSEISLHVTTPVYNDRYISHNGSAVDTSVVSALSSKEDKLRARWIVRAGVGNDHCYSFESADKPGHFIRQALWKLVLNQNDGSKQFGEDTTFCAQPGLNGQGDSIRSWTFPTRYLRHYHGMAYIACQNGPEEFDAGPLYTDDVSFVIQFDGFG